MKGLITNTLSNSFRVRMDDGRYLLATVRGNFRLRGIRSTSPLAVGDRVEVEEQTDGTNWITDLEPRRNYIIRRATNLSKESHILAANLDLAALVITLAHPVTSLVFVDRFLVTAEAYSVPACLIINKIDLLTPAERETVEQYKALYERLHYPVFLLSAEQDKMDNNAPARATLLHFFAGKRVLLSGNSGVGKSTLLNLLAGQAVAKTQDLSKAYDAGTHTTTFSQLLEIEGCQIIDTPGIRGFGVLDMQKEEVGHYFPEIFQASAECRFSSCLHLTEPNCAVVEKVRQGQIAPSRYESYLSILGDIDEAKYR